MHHLNTILTNCTLQESFPGVFENFSDVSDSSDDYDDDGLDAIIRQGDLISCDPSGQGNDSKPWIFGSPGSSSIQQLLRWEN